MHVFVAGICGTFMAGLAVLARQKGFHVSGCDANVYPPMSDLLRAEGIDILEGYDPSYLGVRPDVVVVGNALSRGNPLLEFVLDNDLPYTSGPQWLYENVLAGRHVIAISGTHGKTTTASMTAHALEQLGAEPGFLVGGIPEDFGVSAKLGNSELFVVEADEYDTAFFDKRSKFVHYRPRTLIINNIEFDHADIFPDLAAIQRQFHHLVRTVPANGTIVFPAHDENVHKTLEMGLWSSACSFAVGDSGADWNSDLLVPDGSEFCVRSDSSRQSVLVRWPHCGMHNVANATAALAAIVSCGFDPADVARAIESFAGVKRRMERIGCIAGIEVYDDFAHHPTAIRTTLDGLRAREGNDARIIAVIEPRSNTMRLGVHKAELADAASSADLVIWYQPRNVDWDIESAVAADGLRTRVMESVEKIIGALVDESCPGDRIIIMSNGGFEGIHHRLLAELGASRR